MIEEIILTEQQRDNHHQKPQHYMDNSEDAYNSYFEKWNAEKHKVQVQYSIVSNRRLKFTKKELDSALQDNSIVDMESD